MKRSCLTCRHLRRSDASACSPCLNATNNFGANYPFWEPAGQETDVKMIRTPLPTTSVFPPDAFSHADGSRECRPKRVPAPLLIALTSPAMGSGKSEVARILIDELGFKSVKFAGTMKHMMRTFLTRGLGVDHLTVERMVEGDLKGEPIDGLGVTPRRLMQTLGTEWRLSVIPDLWARMAAIQAEANLAMGHSVVIDDMRFHVELEAVRKLGGHAVRILRPSATVTEAHASEGALDDVRMPGILNDSSLSALHERALRMVDYLRGQEYRQAA